MKTVIEIACKKFSKEKKELQKSIVESARRLTQRISDYKNAGVSFDNIFNDDRVKYDKHGKFFTYKGRSINNSQIRLLYYCNQTNSTTEIVIVDYEEKRKNNKNYIVKFSEYDKVVPDEYFADIKMLKVC